jgi:hypothetical protein
VEQAIWRSANQGASATGEAIRPNSPLRTQFSKAAAAAAFAHSQVDRSTFRIAATRVAAYPVCPEAGGSRLRFFFAGPSASRELQVLVPWVPIGLEVLKRSPHRFGANHGKRAHWAALVDAWEIARVAVTNQPAPTM